MKAFLSALVQVASLKASDPFLFVGDFNTGIGPADGPLKNFGDVDRFVALQGTGFNDAWRHFTATKLNIHDERETRTSDHSASLVEIED
jgi:hypothetical protein